MSVAGHLLQTKVTLAPGSNAQIEFEWVPADGASNKTPTRFKMGGRERESSQQQQQSSSSSSSGPTSSQHGTEGIKKEEGDHSVAQYVLVTFFIFTLTESPNRRC
jgi:hypothetical protein